MWAKIIWKEACETLFVQFNKSNIVDVQDIQALLDSGTEGVIVFSLGSLTRVSSFPPEVIESLMSAFSELPYQVLIKYEEDLPNAPTNVHATKWLQQRDIVGLYNLYFVWHFLK